ncbi:MAG: hypothetical protein JO002_10905, partial [Burkholderiaceae bacterium]|nr:hypothetical protein [Burkholderiaceae bacterium]
MKSKVALGLILAMLGCSPTWAASANSAPNELCPRPTVGSTVADPADLHSMHGELKLDLQIQN